MTHIFYILNALICILLNSMSIRMEIKQQLQDFIPLELATKYYTKWDCDI
jgi:hypothetical protein